MKTVNYKGKGEHSVRELELIIEQQAEELHLIKSGQKQLPIHGVVGCQREQLKTTKEPLPYDEWKKHLKIQKPNNQIYQIGDEYITLNEVLEMYEDYYHSF